MKTVHIVHHTFDKGSQIEVFATKKSATTFIKIILKEYSEEYEQKVTLKNITEVTRYCNLEYLKREIQY